MIIKTFLDTYRNIATNEDIKNALSHLCPDNQVLELVKDGDLKLFNDVIALLADFIERDPIIIDRKKIINERRMAN